MATNNRTNNKYYKYSFSGTDVSNVCWFSLLTNGTLYTSSPAVLDSLTTISISVHEAKTPVRNLGSKACKGYAGSIRTIAGTLIGSVINNHPLDPLFHLYMDFKAQEGSWSYSVDKDRDGSGYVSSLDTKRRTHVYPTILPPFNIAFNAVTELAALQITNPDGSVQIDDRIGRSVVPYAQFMLFGVEFLDDNMTVSINNPMTENAFTFVAQDYAVLNENLAGLGPEQIFEALKRESFDPIYSSNEYDRQAIWMESLNLKHKPGEASLEYIRDEEGNITSVSTFHKLPPGLEK